MRVVDRIMLGILTVDGFVVGVLSLAYAYTRFGGAALPVVALLAGLVNAVLVWLAAGYTAGPSRYAPLAGWGAAVAVGVFPGPGGDVLLSQDGSLGVATLLLLALGAGIPAAVIWSGRLSPGPILSPSAGRAGPEN